ncbi:MAG: sugar phosphate isomerase/epimerase [Rhodospirillales bacterium]|nr:sugar phosphate isomerase/epimerase [Rhodospirillales bacterium]
MTPHPLPTRHPEARLIHRGLGGVEFFDLAPEQIARLDRIAADLRAEGRSRLSFHVPVVRPEYYPFDGVHCFFLSDDAGRRDLSFRLVADTLDLARRWRADYAVCHLTFGATDTRDPALARALARDACARFAAMSRSAGVPLDVEFAAYTDSFHEPVSFLDALAPHGELGICVDIGHAYLGALKRKRSYLDDIAALAPRARSMHLWNSTGPECHDRYHHVPLHPSQRPEDGWIDVPAALAAVLARNPDARLVFEYPVDSVTPRIQEGYDWVAGLAAGLRARAGAADRQERTTGRIRPP